MHAYTYIYIYIHTHIRNPLYSSLPGCSLHVAPGRGALQARRGNALVRGNP